jgi:hypothetical protein
MAFAITAFSAGAGSTIQSVARLASGNRSGEEKEPPGNPGESPATRRVSDHVRGGTARRSS